MKDWNSKSWDWKPDGEEGLAYAGSADRNKVPIGETLGAEIFQRADVNSVLEIGSGTGQHLEHFAPLFPGVIFFPTELSQQGRDSVAARTKPFPNVKAPFGLDVLNFDLTRDENLIGLKTDAIICSNIYHVAPPGIVEGLANAANLFGVKIFGAYGAFKRHGECTSPGNVSFDEMLRNANPTWGLKDLESEIVPVFEKHGFGLLKVVDMPSNNFVILFERK
jgi:SAM-dependent methyltransferase